VFSPKPWKKIGADPSCRLREKSKKAHFIPKNDVTEPKSKMLDYSNYQLKICYVQGLYFRLKSQKQK